MSCFLLASLQVYRVDAAQSWSPPSPQSPMGTRVHSAARKELAQHYQCPPPLPRSHLPPPRAPSMWVRRGLSNEQELLTRMRTVLRGTNALVRVEDPDEASWLHVANLAFRAVVRPGDCVCGPPHTQCHTHSHTFTHIHTHSHTVSHTHTRTHTVSHTHTRAHTCKQHTHAHTLTPSARDLFGWPLARRVPCC
jgi:hypothetical protein